MRCNWALLGRWNLCENLKRKENVSWNENNSDSDPGLIRWRSLLWWACVYPGISPCQSYACGMLSLSQLIAYHVQLHLIFIVAFPNTFQEICTKVVFISWYKSLGRWLSCFAWYTYTWSQTSRRLRGSGQPVFVPHLNKVKEGSILILIFRLYVWGE